jgi:hypothetical protein
MGSVRGKATEDYTVFEAELHQLQRFVGAESIIYQYAGLAIRSFFCLRVENVSNPVQTDRCICITTVGVTIMPSRGRISCPSAPVGCSRPNDQRVEIPTVCRDTLYCSDQGSFYTCPSMCLQLMPAYEDLERVEDT